MLQPRRLKVETIRSVQCVTPPHSRRRQYQFVAPFLLLLLLPHLADASAGDFDFRFQYCVGECVQSCPSQGWPIGSGTASTSAFGGWDLWLFRWDCKDNCQYNCMRENVELRETNSEPVVKYFGKWPFVRVFGMQELLSTVFSIANLIPHLQYFLQLDHLLPTHCFLRNAWRVYAVSAMNTWFWSTAFHARDSLLTERLDYFCATMSILFSLVLCIFRIFNIRRISVIVGIASVAITFFIAHCSYLHFVHFDYGYNMTVAVTLGSVYCVAWIAFALYIQRPYSHKIIKAMLLILGFAAFEVFDFPPWFGLLDAHAVWHAATPYVSYLTWQFIVEDANYQEMLGVVKVK